MRISILIDNRRWLAVAGLCAAFLSWRDCTQPRALAADDGRPAIDLTHVVDREPLAFEESAAYYALLQQAQQVTPDALQTSAERLLQHRWQSSRYRNQPVESFPLFYELTQHPQEYRGEPVSLRGHLVRLDKYAAGPNDYGIETLYEGWLVTPDSQSHPATIICTEVPEGMPIGEQLVDGVSVTGYFFKLRTYPSRDKKIRFAPMVLARSMSWSPEQAGQAGWPISQPLVTGLLLGLAAIGVCVAIIVSRRSRRARVARFREAVPESPPEFLNDLTP